MLRTALAIALTTGLVTAQHVCSATLLGTGCATLDITFTPIGGGNNTLTLSASGLHQHKIGAMVWGEQRINQPVIPGSLCPLLTTYTWGHTFISDFDGTWSWSRSWPHWFHGYYYMQVGTVSDAGGGLDVITTDMLIAQCVL